MFGGRLTSSRVEGMAVVSLVSPVPILRRGGHSQGWDEAAVDLAAFFGRVMVAVDFVPGFEARMAAATPAARYAAFVADCIARYEAAMPLRSEHPALWALIRAEADRLRGRDPAAWSEGTLLAAEVAEVRPA